MASKKVAVVGCGVAGLAAARELRREGHKVVVFERGTQLGGIWAYTPKTDSDLLGLDPNRTIVHPSMYKSLRTNSPRELTSFRDFPLVASGKPNRDSRKFPCHDEVLQYLEDFACRFRLKELIRYQTEVLFVGLEKNGNWNVKSKRESIDELDEKYDAVVVCNGHNTQPSIADIPGIEVWPGWQCHSHNYRTPEPYQDQVIPFMLFELQSKWIAGVLSSRVSLPSKEKMMQDIEDFYAKLEATEVAKRHTHRLGDFQCELEDCLAKECGCSPIEEWRKEMFYADYTSLITRPGTYRDEQDCSEELSLEALLE